MWGQLSDLGFMMVLPVIMRDHNCLGARWSPGNLRGVPGLRVDL